MPAARRADRCAGTRGATVCIVLFWDWSMSTLAVSAMRSHYSMLLFRIQPSPDFSWMSEYKPVAQKYLDDSRAWLAWREHRGSDKSAADVKRALDNLRTLIPKLQKNTAISREAGARGKTAGQSPERCGGRREARHEQEHQELLRPRNAAMEWRARSVPARGGPFTISPAPAKRCEG